MYPEGADGTIKTSFLTGAAAGAVPLALPPVAAAQQNLSPERVLGLFSRLPGKVAVKIYAPPVPGGAWTADSVQCLAAHVRRQRDQDVRSREALRQADSPNVVAKTTASQLALNASGSRT